MRIYFLSYFYFSFLSNKLFQYYFIILLLKRQEYFDRYKIMLSRRLVYVITACVIARDASTTFLKISEFTRKDSVRSMHDERNIACG